MLSMGMLPLNSSVYMGNVQILRNIIRFPEKAQMQRSWFLRVLFYRHIRVACEGKSKITRWIGREARRWHIWVDYRRPFQFV